MAHIEFVDRHGVSGTVDEELLVEYDGKCGEIERYVADLRDERLNGNRNFASRDALCELVIDLPNECAVQEARLCDQYDS